ncbi:beta-ketoacyl-[acyl-carrier-protein] synthase family protein [Micromonospora sp. NPDC005203]|uniref:beta-ketoacyl-[acyl-carrier-protein] synthase family protein n=1 Tax=Micromonospora sp. NPDC005203 TaxID=3364226 RepID=UPI0036C90C3F
MRVVVTGLGAVSSLGVGVEPLWQGLLAGKVGTGPLQRVTVPGLPDAVGGEVVPAGVRGRPLCLGFGLQAAGQAVADAGLPPGRDRTGVYVGAVLGNRSVLEAPALAFHQGGAAQPDAGPVPGPGELAAAVSRELGAAGPSVVVGTACAAGNTALSVAVRAIRAGRLDAAVVCGVDELAPSMFMLFGSLRAMSRDVVRPFDAERTGMLVAEGGAALVVESEASARARGAHLYGEVLACADTSDAYHITSPHPQGRGAKAAMRAALTSARLDPADIGHISAHGTGTRANDTIEAQAIREVFGPVTDALPVTSLKGALGHMHGAASLIEAIGCLLAIRDSVIPATANLVRIDPDCRLELVLGEPRHGRVDVALNNAFGFGGNISCSVFARIGSGYGRD